MDVILVLYVFILTQCGAVNIERIEVPSLVEVGTDSVVLDCQFSGSVGPGSGLVMKWFFNGSAGLVYQWIPPMRPQVRIRYTKPSPAVTQLVIRNNFPKDGLQYIIRVKSRDRYLYGETFSKGFVDLGVLGKVVPHHQVIGLLKRKVDMSFRISEEPSQAYRAIKIVKPSTDLSGNYTCVVSTFMAEDRRTKPMLVYSTGKGLNFYQEKKYVFLVTLICLAEGLYPKPEITISSQGKPLHQAIDTKMDSWGLYSVTSTAIVHDDDVASPFEEFVCTLILPSTNYTTKRSTIYYPGFMPTSFIAAVEMEKHQERQSNGSSCLTPTIVIYLLLHLKIF